MGVEAVQCAPPSDHHPTGASPAVMGAASLSLAGCDCRPMGASPIETRIAPRVFGYCASKRRQELTELDSRDASKIRRGGRASGLKRARRCHVCLSSDRTACAVPLVLIAYGDTQFGGQAQGHGDRVAIACWLRLPSDGDKPHRNEERSACVCLPHFEACYRMDRVC